MIDIILRTRISRNIITQTYHMLEIPPLFYGLEVYTSIDKTNLFAKKFSTNSTVYVFKATRPHHTQSIFLQQCSAELSLVLHSECLGESCLPSSCNILVLQQMGEIFELSY